MSLNQLIIQIFRDGIKGKFLFHLILNLVMSSIFLPILTKRSNEYLIGNEIQKGIAVTFCLILVKIIIDFHNVHFLEIYIKSFRRNSHRMLEQLVSLKVNSLNWNVIRKLEKEEIDRIKDDVKWPMLYLVDILVSQGVQIFPFIGYFIWLVYVSPMSIFLYIFGISMLMYWYPLPGKKENSYHEIWDQYYFYASKQFTEIIHHRGIENNEEMGKAMEAYEKLRENDNYEVTKYLQNIENTFNLIFAANLVLFVSSITNVTDILIYIQYTGFLKSNLSFFGNSYKQYKECKKYFAKMEDKLLNYQNREEVEQLHTLKQIKINHLNYTYPTKGDASQFSLELKQPIEINHGEIVRLDGNSGNGKSTFLDIICAIIPNHEYQFDIMFDQAESTKGFDQITSLRIYAEQFEKIDWKSSVYEIVSSVYNPNRDAVIDIVTPNNELVWKALEMAKCDDFMKPIDDSSHKKWMHAKNISPSGGQKGRISIARIIYRMFIDHPKMIVLDEIDKSIQADMAVDILKSIYSYCKENDIICLVAAHSTEVKNMEYDLVIKFNLGQISI